MILAVQFFFKLIFLHFKLDTMIQNLKIKKTNNFLQF